MLPVPQLSRQVLDTGSHVKPVPQRSPVAHAPPSEPAAGLGRQMLQPLLVSTTHSKPTPHVPPSGPVQVRRQMVTSESQMVPEGHPLLWVHCPGPGGPPLHR